jgi:Nucleotide modification associated domain 2
MTELIRLFTYKQTHDTGFAPNPFHGVCTLATCKPKIRLHKREGDWIAGFTSVHLNKDGIGHERLIYLMHVTDKLPLELYFASDQYSVKRASDPADLSASCVRSVGDNIYELRDGLFIQHPNRTHNARHIPRDISGKYALIGKEFYYFGNEPLIIPIEIRPRIPKGQAGHGVRTTDAVRAQAFVDYVKTRGPGVHARPNKWKTGDMSWKQS